MFRCLFKGHDLTSWRTHSGNRFCYRCKLWVGPCCSLDTPLSFHSFAVLVIALAFLVALV